MAARNNEPAAFSTEVSGQPGASTPDDLLAEWTAWVRTQRDELAIGHALASSKYRVLSAPAARSRTPRELVPTALLEHRQAGPPRQIPPAPANVSLPSAPLIGASCEPAAAVASGARPARVQSTRGAGEAGAYI
mmetsp:Transcript_16401/g.37816  ORF Transcript_16401/g.37816 Transcript_16401/m.37816 type:complete len:134 (-) Transcript_16401:2-403(-)